MIALIVTLACLPLLVLDMVQGSPVSSATETVSAPSDSSLVVATPLPEVTTTTVEVAVAAPPTTVAPAPTTTAAPRPVQTTTTTKAPRPVVVAPTRSDADFLACIRWRESRDNYSAVDRSATFRGAYQIYQGGWDSTANRIGRSDLMGVAPNEAAPADQDQIALALYHQLGTRPWNGACA
ncbi:MAG: hypothetical protein WEA11_08680 [Acidimicrobiales bacterium]